MTVVINGSGTMTGLAVGGFNDNIITKNEMATGGAWAPAGTVLQVVQTVYSTETISSSSTWVDTGATASITPTSATSKVLIMVAIGEVYKNSANAANCLSLRLMKNGSIFLQFTNGTLYTNTAIANQGSVSFAYLDSPATTASTTYSVQFRNLTNAASVYVQSNGMPTTVTLMEIAA